MLKHCNPFLLPLLTRIDWNNVTWHTGRDSASVSILEEGDTKEVDSDDDDSDDADFVPCIRVRYMCFSKMVSKWIYLSYIQYLAPIYPISNFI